MFGAIKYGLGNVANVHGRDARQTFWYYVLFVVVLNFGVGVLMSIPLSVKAMSVAMEAARNQADAASIQQQTMAIMAETLPMMTWVGVATGAATMLLLLASTVRRLHDIGISGWVVLVPGILYVVSLARQPMEMQRVMDAMLASAPGTMANPQMMMQGGGLQALLTWVPALIIIVIGLRNSQDGPNRFGEAPVRF